MDFSPALERMLPPELPHRSRLIEIADAHLQAIVAANEYMNLTRITDVDEAAVKHVYDCVAPWTHFEGARRVLDAGTGAGFPGVPLAVLFPEMHWILAESTGKKAHFVENICEDLGLSNVEVLNARAEAVALQRRVDVITARAVAPLAKLIGLFGRPVRDGARMLLFKGPDVESEMADSGESKLQFRVVSRYDLPGGMGSRALVEIKA